MGESGSGAVVDHSTAGAQHALEKLGDEGKLLAYIIAGHHSGLPDGHSNKESCLIKRLVKDIPDFSACPSNILESVNTLQLPFILNRSRFSFQLSFFIRMLFSCLVDADRLDSEQFCDPSKARTRSGYASIDDLSTKLYEYLEKLQKTVPDTLVNRVRSEVLNRCIGAAEKESGLFTLTVPTGGGKTLSSLAFALSHAKKYGKKRVIYVLPFTSIIEQNADVFRSVLDKYDVLEHHSNFESRHDDSRSDLAAENWDAPLIVTTNVQFFESLFAAKSSRCRRIHNIANSVVILDEAQMLPADLLIPCLEALRELSTAYRTTIVLCTATQPALSKTDSFPTGLDNVREIVGETARLHRRCARVIVKDRGPIPDDVLAAELSSHEQVLCIVNTRRNAHELFERLKPAGSAYHLSANMCPAHRSKIIAGIKLALQDGAPCRVISTQLIEAGVDIDFPVVYRAAAGIDSIAQAAGRCNREGKLEGKGTVHVFRSESAPPPGFLRQAAQTGETVLEKYGDDPLEPAAVEDYFRRLFHLKGEELDRHGIIKSIGKGCKTGDYPFREVAEKFRLIDTATFPVIVQWNEDAAKTVKSLRFSENGIYPVRSLQRYTVTVHEKILVALERSGAVEWLHDRFCVLVDPRFYSDEIGLFVGGDFVYDPNSLIS